MKKSLATMFALLVAVGSPLIAQESNSHDAGALFAMAGVHYHLREPLTGGLAQNETFSNLRAELGVGMLGRNDAGFAPFLYGGDFRMLLSSAALDSATAVFTDAPLRGAFGAQFGDLLVAAFAGPGLYSAFLTDGGDATRVAFGFEAGAKAIFTWGLYAEASFVAPEGLAVLQDSSFLDPQSAGLRVGIGWNFLSATPAEVREASAAQ